MKQFAFDEAGLAKRLSMVSAERRAIFAACCAQRLLPAFSEYAAEKGLPLAASLEPYIDRVWRTLISGDEGIGWKELEEACLELHPEEGEEGERVAYGEDAVAAVAYAIRARGSKSASDAALAARRAYETVDQFVIRLFRKQGLQQGKHGFPELMILNHPVCQRELFRQSRDMEELERVTPASERACFISLREQAVSEGGSLFSLS